VYTLIKGDKKMKTKLKKRFKEIYGKELRLLAVQLDGFSHRVVYDNGEADSNVNFDEFSGCMTEGNWSSKSVGFFKDIGHSAYQGNPTEYIYLEPNQR
jgi:hypothetical protein